MQVDKGGLFKIFGGANVMAPGLTSLGGKMEDVPAGAIVSIYVEGKQHALAVGITIMSSEDIK